MKKEENDIIKIISLNERIGKHLTALEAINITEEVANKYSLPSANEDFDLNQIPIEILDKGWKRYRPYLFMGNHRSSLSNRLVVEGKEYRQKFENIKKIITDAFELSEEQFKIVKGAHGLYAAILSSVIDDNLEVIEKVMEDKGFFRSQPIDNEYLKDKKERVWCDMRFELKDLKDVTSRIHRKFEYLYHITPSINAEAILRNGLIVSNCNSEYKYSEDRAFLVQGNAKGKDIQELVNTLYKQADEKNIPNLSEKYTLFIFDLNKIDNKIRFFYNVNEPKGIYTKMPIPSSAIIGQKEIIANTSNN